MPNYDGYAGQDTVPRTAGFRLWHILENFQLRRSLPHVTAALVIRRKYVACVCDFSTLICVGHGLMIRIIWESREATCFRKAEHLPWQAMHNRNMFKELQRPAQNPETRAVAQGFIIMSAVMLTRWCCFYPTEAS